MPVFIIDPIAGRKHMKEGTAIHGSNGEVHDMHGPVLVVDDDDGIRETLTAILSEKNYAVITASNGREAIDQVEKNHVPIIIMDMRMPGMNGIEAFGKIHEISRDTRVIFSSAYTGNIVIPPSWKSVVDGILEKTR